MTNANISMTDAMPGQVPSPAPRAQPPAGVQPLSGPTPRPLLDVRELTV